MARLMNPVVVVILMAAAVGSIGAIWLGSLWRPVLAVIIWILLAQLLPWVCQTLLVLGLYAGPIATRMVGASPTGVVRSLGMLRGAGEPAHSILGTAIGVMVFNVVTGWPGGMRLAIIAALASLVVLFVRGILGYSIIAVRGDARGRTSNSDLNEAIRYVDAEVCSAPLALRVVPPAPPRPRAPQVAYEHSPPEPTRTRDTQTDRYLNHLESADRDERISARYGLATIFEQRGEWGHAVELYTLNLRDGADEPFLVSRLAHAHQMTGAEGNGQQRGNRATETKRNELLYYLCQHCGHQSQGSRKTCKKCRMSISGD
jgi:hypothetical protein